MRQSIYFKLEWRTDLNCSFPWLVAVWFCFDGRWSFYRFFFGASQLLELATAN